MKYFVGLAIVILFASAAPNRAAAAWSTTGSLPQLGSGRVWSLVFNPNDNNTALAGTDKGIFRSSDGGATWTTTNVTGVLVWSIAFDVHSSNTVYAGTGGKGIQRSTDNGVTWSDDSSGLQNLDARVVAVGLDAIAVATNDGVALSSDGTSWHDGGLRGYQISALAVAANSPQFTLVAGVDSGNLSKGYLFSSQSGSGNWTALQSGLPAQDSQKPTFALSLAAGPLPQNATTRPLIVNTNKGTFHSGDSGGTWSQSSIGPAQAPPASGSTGLCSTPPTLTSAIFSPTNPNLIYGGSDAEGGSCGDLVRSTDGGSNFVTDDGDLHAGLPDQSKRSVEVVAVSTDQPPKLLLAINDATNGGSVWRDTDQNAPTGNTSTESTGAPLASPTPAPATQTPKANGSASGNSSQKNQLTVVLSSLLVWPFPLSLELFALLLLIYIIIRWRQQKIDIEGPPPL